MCACLTVFLLAWLHCEFIGVQCVAMRCCVSWWVVGSTDIMQHKTMPTVCARAVAFSCHHPWDPWQAVSAGSGWLSHVLKTGHQDAKGCLVSCQDTQAVSCQPHKGLRPFQTLYSTPGATNMREGQTGATHIKAGHIKGQTLSINFPEVRDKVVCT